MTTKKNLTISTILLLRFTKLHSLTNIHNYFIVIIYSTHCSHIYVNKQNIVQSH